MTFPVSFQMFNVIANPSIFCSGALALSTYIYTIVYSYEYITKILFAGSALSECFMWSDFMECSLCSPEP